MNVSDLVDRTRYVTSLFDQVVPRTWGIDAMAIELMGEVGSLADEIMLQEGYRPTKNADRLRLEDELTDVLFMLVRIADFYHIDLERAYMGMIERTETKLHKLIGERSGNPADTLPSP